MAERSKAAVLKTVVVKATWGSNPYLSANQNLNRTPKKFGLGFIFCYTIIAIRNMYEKVNARKKIWKH